MKSSNNNKQIYFKNWSPQERFLLGVWVKIRTSKMQKKVRDFFCLFIKQINAYKLFLKEWALGA